MFSSAGASQQHRPAPTLFSRQFSIPAEHTGRKKEKHRDRMGRNRPRRDTSPMPQFTITSAGGSSRGSTPSPRQQTPVNEVKSSLLISVPRLDRVTRRQQSENNLRPSVSFQHHNSESAATDDSSRRRHSGQPLVHSGRGDKQKDRADKEQQRLPLRAFKKIGRVGTLPALAHTSAAASAIQSAMRDSGDDMAGSALTGGGGLSGSSRTGGGGSAFPRWGHRRGSHMVGWDSARPQSTARHQQQMLERLYTKGELREYQQLFKMFDTDGSGAIGREELKGAMVSIGLQADEAELDRLIREVDEDGNGEIDFPEFCQCMKRSQQSGLRLRLSNEEVARQCFEVFDQDGNGLITENEFIYVAKEVGGFSQELAEFVFRELLGDSATGQLDQSRFSAIVDDYMLSDGANNSSTSDSARTDNDKLQQSR